MGDADVRASTWRLVELGRIVLFTKGEHEDKLAAIVEVIDHKRVLLDGPASDPKKAVPRHCARLSDVTLTHIVISKIPRAIGTGPLKQQWEAQGVEKEWNRSVWAQSRARSARRRQLSDFERFKVMRLRKLAKFEEKRAYAKQKAVAA